jgi:hypothetical protein
MTILRHINCADPYCETCLEDHLALGREIDNRTGVDRVDHLGKFYLWLKQRGIPPETEYGWGTEAYFDEEYIAAYVKEWTHREGGGDDINSFIEQNHSVRHD